MTYTLDLTNTVEHHRGPGTKTWTTTSTTDAINSGLVISGGTPASWAYNMFQTSGVVPDNLGYEVGVTIHHCPESQNYRNAGIVFDFENTGTNQVAFLRFGQSKWQFESFNGEAASPVPADQVLGILKPQIGGSSVSDLSFTTVEDSATVIVNIPGHGMQVGDTISFYSARNCTGGSIGINGINIIAGDGFEVTSVHDDGSTFEFIAPMEATSGGEVTTCASEACSYFIEQHMALLFEKTFADGGAHNGYDAMFYWLKDNDPTLLMSKHLPTTTLKLGSGQLGLTSNNAKVAL